MAKKYELVKSFMRMEPHSIIEEFGEDSYHFPYQPYVIPKELVENNPEWFEEVVEKEFVWTDELVREFVATDPSIHRCNEDMIEFKAYKDKRSSIPSGKGTANDVLNTEDKSTLVIHFSLLHSWEQNMDILKSELLKHNIKPNTPANDVLNTEKEWEIVSWRSAWSGTIYLAKDFSSGVSEHPIHSVKRLSDNEVFSVGDMAEVVKGTARKGWSYEISSFAIVGDTMVADFLTWRQPISDLKKCSPSQPQNNKERTVVTIDGKYHINYGNYEAVHFRVHKDFPPEKMEELRQAIEKILNHE